MMAGGERGRSIEHGPNPAVSQAVAMLFEAHRENDPMLIFYALKHLEFLDGLSKLTEYRGLGA